MKADDELNLTTFKHICRAGRGVTFGIMCIINMVLFAISGSLSMIVYIRSWVVFRRGSPLPVDRVRL